MTSFYAQKITFLMFFVLLTSCTVRTNFTNHFVTPDSKSLVKAPAFVTKAEAPLFAKACQTRLGYPFFWRSEADALVAKAILERPEAVGVMNAEFTSEVFVLGVYNRVCLEVKGQPVYVAAE